MNQLKGKLGNDFDSSKISEMLKGKDLSQFGSISDVMNHLKESLKDLDGDGKEEGIVEELKGKASQLLGGLGNIFKK